MRTSKRKQTLGLAAARLVKATLGWVTALALLASCGRPENLVVVNVSGLDSTITELHVSMTLDGTGARNQQPTADDPDPSSFSVYKNMQSFGISVPSGTKLLGVKVDGLNTSRVAVKTGSGQLDVTQKNDLAIQLH